MFANAAGKKRFWKNCLDGFREGRIYDIPISTMITLVEFNKYFVEYLR